MLQWRDWAQRLLSPQHHRDFRGAEFCVTGRIREVVESLCMTGLLLAPCHLERTHPCTHIAHRTSGSHSARTPVLCLSP